MVQDTKNYLLTNLSGDKKPSGDTTTLFVSLYLIILAFFIVLNSISNQTQAKVKSATESVNRAFDNPFAPETDSIEISAKENSEFKNDDFHGQLQGVFASLIGFEGKLPPQGGNVIKVEFNQDVLYAYRGSEFRDDQKPFFFQLSRFLRNASLGTIREIEYTIYAGDVFPAGPTYWEEITVLRAGAIINKMTEMGVRESQISIGVAPGNKGGVKIVFVERDEKTSRQNLKDADQFGLGEQNVPTPGQGGD